MFTEAQDTSTATSASPVVRDTNYHATLAGAHAQITSQVFEKLAELRNGNNVWNTYTTDTLRDPLAKEAAGIATAMMTRSLEAFNAHDWGV
jgi:hypothetical protein